MYLDLVAKVDNSAYTRENGVWLFTTHDDLVIGKIIDSVAEKLRDISWFHLDESTHVVKISDPTDLDIKFADLALEWRNSKVFSCLEGWRNELYTCYTRNRSKYFSIERSAAALFGIVTYGCHITGYIPQTKQIWVPRRSYFKPTYPGMLDNTVAGGLGDGIDFKECALKECWEEAGLPSEYIEPRLKQCGVVTYEFVDPKTGYYQPEVECIYDVAMEPPTEGGRIPQPQDGEAQDFKLMSYKEVQERMLAGEFKYNCALVLVDFFIRHGEIEVDTEPDFFEIVSRCHRRLDYPLR